MISKPEKCHQSDQYDSFMFNCFRSDIKSMQALVCRITFCWLPDATVRNEPIRMLAVLNSIMPLNLPMDAEEAHS